MSDRHFASHVLSRAGHVIVTGMGNPGLICREIAATLASTGTPAFSVPVLGAALQPKDVLHLHGLWPTELS